MSDIIGKSIDRYRMLEQAGVGGMATVYKAFDTRLERDVAIKIIRSDAFPPNQLDRILKRFEREAKALGRLSHPNIIKVIDYGEYLGAPYLVMEYLAGGTLKQRLLGKPIPWQNAVKLLLPVAGALEYAHEQKIIHRDIKPSNILLTQRGQPMLTDFGIAKLLETDEAFTLTGTGIGVGTPEYMSPEQWTGSATVQSDIYSLGVVLYEMITGRKPYTANTPAAILLKQATEPLPRPGKYVSNLPDSIEKLLLKALASNLNVRYQNVGELIGGLENLLMEKNRSGRPATMPVPNKSETTISDSSATYDQQKTNFTKQQTATYTQGQGNTNTTQTMHPAVNQNNRRGWWPWVAGLAVVVCMALVGILSIGSNLWGAENQVVVTETPLIAEVPDTTAVPIATAVEVAINIPDTPVPAAPTLQPTLPPTLESKTPAYQLKFCDSSTEDICVYSISPQPVGLIISFKFKTEMNASNMPILTVNGERFTCELLAAYPGRLICNGASIVGNAELKLVSTTNDLICSGIFKIEKYVAPIPTKKNSGNNYP